MANFWLKKKKEDDFSFVLKNIRESRFDLIARFSKHWGNKERKYAIWGKRKV